MRVLVGLMILIACAGGPALAEVPTVHNPEQAPRSSTIKYEEVWRAGADDDADYLFGVIMQVTTDDHANIYLLDTQQQQVFKFSADGQYRGLMCRKGEGPGEIDNTYNMRYLGDGRLGFMRMVPSVMVMVDTLGTPLPQLEFAIDHPEEQITFGGMFSCESAGDSYYGSGRFYLVDKSKGSYMGFVASFDSEGQQVHRFSHWYGGYDFSRPIKVDELADWHRARLWATDGDGRIFHTTARDSYVVEIRDPDGTLVGRLDRQWTVHRRSGAEKDKAKEGYSFSSTQELPPISYRMADTDPAIGSIQVMGDELWITDPVASRRAAAAGNMVTDVFDLTGHLLETRTMVVPHDKDLDVLRFLPDGRVVRLKNVVSAMASTQVDRSTQQGDKRGADREYEDEDPMEVIVYRAVGGEH